MVMGFVKIKRVVVGIWWKEVREGVLGGGDGWIWKAAVALWWCQRWPAVESREGERGDEIVRERA